MRALCSTRKICHIKINITSSWPLESLARKSNKRCSSCSSSASSRREACRAASMASWAPYSSLLVHQVRPMASHCYNVAVLPEARCQTSSALLVGRPLEPALPRVLDRQQELVLRLEKVLARALLPVRALRSAQEQALPRVEVASQVWEPACQRLCNSAQG